LGIRISRITNLVIATFVLMLLSIIVCLKTEVTLEMQYNTANSTEVVDSIRSDLGILACETIELLMFEVIPPKGGWNGTEIAIILKSTDGKFQLAKVVREPESIHSHRWSVYSLDLQLIDGTGEDLTFEREYTNRPTVKDIDDFKRWVNEW